MLYNTHTTIHSLTVIWSLADGRLQRSCFCLKSFEKLSSSYTDNFSVKYYIINTGVGVERKQNVWQNFTIESWYRIACLLSGINKFYVWAVAGKIWIVKNTCACWQSTKNMFWDDLALYLPFLWCRMKDVLFWTMWLLLSFCCVMPPH